MPASSTADAAVEYKSLRERRRARVGSCNAAVEAFIKSLVNLNGTGESKGMTTQDLQGLKAELHEIEGEMHGVEAKVERIERERAAGQAHDDAELSTAREQL